MPVVYLVRHGETAWSAARRHTGRTDVPLTERGEDQARALGARLSGVTFARVLTSPLQRATRTCELAGFPGAERDPDLVEWNYGDYEGRRTDDIRAARPGWNLFRDGCPNGETADDVGERADRVIARVRAAPGPVLVFASAHILRVVAARWLRLPAVGGSLLLLSTASVSVLGCEHGLDQPVLRLWNDTNHVTSQP
jgi:probable phosphoglycerate mutase